MQVLTYVFLGAFACALQYVVTTPNQAFSKWWELAWVGGSGRALPPYPPPMQPGRVFRDAPTINEGQSTANERYVDSYFADSEVTLGSGDHLRHHHHIPYGHYLFDCDHFHRHCAVRIYE